MWEKGGRAFRLKISKFEFYLILLKLYGKNNYASVCIENLLTKARA